MLKEIAEKFGKNYRHDLQAKVLGTVEKDTARICITEMDLPISSEDFLDLYHIKCNAVLTTSCPFMTGTILIRYLRLPACFVCTHFLYCL